MSHKKESEMTVGDLIKLLALSKQKMPVMVQTPQGRYRITGTSDEHQGLPFKRVYIDTEEAERFDVESKAKNVYEYYQKVFGPEPVHDAGTVGLKDYSMTSHCGRECKKIIDKAKELLDICDTHPHVVDNIRAGVLAAVEVVCFG